MNSVKLPVVFGSNRVHYECSCGQRRPISRTYFCRHCLKLRCRDCLSHEVSLYLISKLIRTKLLIDYPTG